MSPMIATISPVEREKSSFPWSTRTRAAAAAAAMNIYNLQNLWSHLLNLNFSRKILNPELIWQSLLLHSSVDHFNNPMSCTSFSRVEKEWNVVETVRSFIHHFLKNGFWHTSSRWSLPSRRSITRASHRRRVTRVRVLSI